MEDDSDVILQWKLSGIWILVRLFPMAIIFAGVMIIEVVIEFIQEEEN